jgi:3-methyladenine DNA glycosylase AlkC
MDEQIEQLTRRVEKTTNGFTDIRRAADELTDRPADERLRIAEALYGSPVHQARMLAIYLYGDLAAQSQAFDRYCRDAGYERALPTIIEWLSDDSANVRRAVSEGLRIWTTRPYFKDHPGEAIALLSPHRSDASEYLRKSIGNALRDISRKHPDLIRAELAQWDLSDKRTLFTYKLACKFLEKQGQIG